MMVVYTVAVPTSQGRPDSLAVAPSRPSAMATSKEASDTPTVSTAPSRMD